MTNRFSYVPASVEKAEERRAALGGLVARTVHKRRYLLVDVAEGQAEHDALVKGLAAWGVKVPMRAGRPSADVPPTTMYRRRRGG